ncbi:Histone acetyltransferase kat7 [Binucleata daphniae]
MKRKANKKNRYGKRKKPNNRKMIMSDDNIKNTHNDINKLNTNQNENETIKFTKIEEGNGFLELYCGLKRSDRKKNETKKEIEELVNKNRYFGYYNCGCFIDTYELFFCSIHVKDMYKHSTLEELVSYVTPSFQQNIPLPDHSWREQYPINLRKIESIETLSMKNYDMKVLHNSPYQVQTKILHVCDQCLQEYADSVSYNRHLIKCKIGSKGKCIYKETQVKSKLYVYEVDGELEKEYCRKLCMVGKFFLDHKTLFYDVEAFFFYTLYVDSDFIGFFSKEKVSYYNLSCIVVLPAHQGKGYGYFLVDVSYKLSIADGKRGTPEKPLSSQGSVLYKNYWINVVYNKIMSCQKSVTINKLSKDLGMFCDDVVYALETLNFLKYGKGGYYIEIEQRSLKGTRCANRSCFII